MSNEQPKDEELKTGESLEEDKKTVKENMRALEAVQAKKSVDASLSCERCGQRKLSYSQVQTSDLDEPRITFCECTVCGNRWKFL